MYFTNFPKIFYDFQQDTTSTTLQILTDITTNVRIRKEVLENITLYDEYDIKEGETPEIIAEKVYGNPELHWIIMLVNQRYDYLKDFPMSSLELQQHMIEKYGADNLETTHHYELNGMITEAIAVIKVPKDITPLLKVNDFLIADSINFGTNAVTNARIESIDLVNNTVVALVNSGKFSAGTSVTIEGLRFDTTAGELIYTGINHFVISSTNGFVVNEKYDIITNSMYEIAINESKRSIKLISSRLVDQLVNEFELLIA